MKDLFAYVREFCLKIQKDISQIQWVGSSNGEYILGPEQFAHSANYLIRGAYDIPQDFTIVFNDSSAYNFGCKNSQDILSDDNWKPIFTPQKNDKSLTPYILFDLNNFRPIPPIDIVNGDPIRLKVFLLNLNLVGIWNTFIEHNFVFNVITDEMLNPPSKGPIHVKCFDGTKVGDIVLRIYIKGLGDYNTSPEREMVVKYIEDVLRTNTNFIKYEEVAATSSILVFFRPFGGLSAS